MMLPGAIAPIATVSVVPFRTPPLLATRVKSVGRLMTSVESAGVAWGPTLVMCRVTTTLDMSHGAVGGLVVTCSSGAGVVGPGVTVPVTAVCVVMVATSVAASSAAKSLVLAG